MLLLRFSYHFIFAVQTATLLDQILHVQLKIQIPVPLVQFVTLLLITVQILIQEVDVEDQVSIVQLLVHFLVDI